MGIYKTMEENWKTYCLMMAIAYIEEMNKPTPHIQIKKYKNKEYKCTCYTSVRLKMNDLETVTTLFKITKIWEKKKNIQFIGNSFKKIKKENYSGQKMFLFTPIWLNQILAECGKIPNKYSYQSAIERNKHLVQYDRTKIDSNKNLFNKLLKNKKLAAGAFIISMDLEFRGLQSANLSLCMSEKYKDFLEFMLKIAKKWNWTNNSSLTKVNIQNSLKLGINASPQYEFRVTKQGLAEIYNLAGPLSNSYKNKCISFNIQRSKKYKNKGSLNSMNNTKNKILNEFKKRDNLTSVQLQFIANVGIDVVLDHLHKLEKESKIKKDRAGKGYIWSLK